MSHKDINEEVVNDKQSRINSAGLINATLENLWKDCYNAMANGDYLKWNIKLDSIWAILGGDEKEGGDEDNKMSSINLKIYEQGSLKGKVGSGFDKKANENNPIQYQFLLKKSLFLRRLQNKQGKGTAYQDEDTFDFD
jgi:hypothetical protein